MADDPTGKYVVKYDGKPLAAKTFHLYTDCSYLLSMTAPTEGPSTIITPSEELMDLMELRLCSGCETRSQIIAPEDVIAKAGGVSVSTALSILEALGANSYELKHIKKRPKQSDKQPD